MLPNVGSKEHSSCHHQLFPRLAKVDDVNSLHSASEDIASQAKSGPPAFSRKYWIATVRRWNGWYTLSGLLVIIMSVCVRIGVCVGARFLVDGWQLWTVCGFRSGQLISLDLPPKSMLVLPLSSSQIFVGVNTLEPIHKHDSYAWQEKLIPILTLCRSHHHWHEFGVSQNF